jgi:uncharacterized membrane protein/protein-disulfide isomerase
MTMMNQPAKPLPRIATQSVFDLKSKLAAVLDWLHRDIRGLPGWPVITLLVICISIAIGTSSYLLWTHVTSSPIAGCGSGGGWIDCDGVAISRWSAWFGVPVSLLALAIYIAMAAALLVATSKHFSRQLREIGWTCVTAAVFAAGMSAIWFITIQLLVLQHICLYCMLAHACGLVATVTILVAGPLRAKSSVAIATLSFAGLMVLVAGQLLASPPASFEIERFDSPPVEGNEAIEFAPPVNRSEQNTRDDNSLPQAPATNTNLQSDNRSYAGLLALSNLFAVDIVQADFIQGVQTPERVATIQGGSIKLKVADWPHIGPSDAKYVVVEMFDYCCPPCRETFKAIRGAQAKLDGQLAIILLPVPLNSDCNPMISVTGPHYIESCELSKLAIAVWRVDPAAFTELHMWMLDGPQSPNYATTLAKANSLVEPEKLKSELASGVADQFIARHVTLYKQVGEGSIPKLMFPRTNVVGKFTSVEALIALIRREGL